MSTLWTPSGEHRVPPAPPGGSSPRGGSSPPGRAPAPGGRTGEAGWAQQAETEPPLSGESRHQPTPEELEEAEADLDAMREQLARTPADVVIANHALGLWELAALHLSQKPPRLPDARLAIDALASLVEGLKGRLGEAERSLDDALAQIRMAFVQISNAERAKGGTGNGG